MNNLIKEIIKPENLMEETLIKDEEFIQGALWGKPRNGHPEGQVIYHIGDVLKNVDKYSTPENRGALRFIAIVHDTFKNKVDKSKPRWGENHHGMIARRFVERHFPLALDDIWMPEILLITELHDEAYNAWCKGDRDGAWDKAEYRGRRLIQQLNRLNALPLYLTFYQCDNETGDKERANFVWFKNLCDNFNNQ